MVDIDDKIIYILIAKNDKPLAEYSYYTGTFNQVCLNYCIFLSSFSSRILPFFLTIILLVFAYHIYFYMIN